jgi:opacity protein-like surface antigen
MLRRILVVVAMTALLSFVLSATAMAVTKTSKTDHHGFYVGLGIGYGNQAIELKDSDYESDREGGGAAVFFIGGALKPNLLLGLDANGWSRKDNNVTRSISTSTICLTYYATPKFFVKGGIGLANANVEVEAYRGTYKYEETGFGLTVGAGMEFRLKKRFALVPSAQWSYQNFDEFKANTFSLTFGIGWFW